MPKEQIQSNPQEGLGKYPAWTDRAWDVRTTRPDSHADRRFRTVLCLLGGRPRPRVRKTVHPFLFQTRDDFLVRVAQLSLRDRRIIHGSVLHAHDWKTEMLADSVCHTNSARSV